jgi:hypothetical protein
MRLRLSPALLAGLALAACGNEPGDDGVSPTGQALCDGSSGARLSFLSGGGHVEQAYEFYGAYGHAAFVIDGQCRYWAAGSLLKGLRTGTLDQVAATDIARKLHWGSLATLSRQRDRDSCPDAGDALIGDGTHAINCSCGCDAGLPAATKEAFANIDAIHQQLMASGSPSDGPLRALSLPETASTVPGGNPSLILTWSLPFSPAELLLQGQSIGRDSGKAIDSPADRSALRQLRAMAPIQTGAEFFVRTGDAALFRIYARDEAPAHVVAGLAALR